MLLELKQASFQWTGSECPGDCWNRSLQLVNLKGKHYLLLQYSRSPFMLALGLIRVYSSE